MMGSGCQKDVSGLAAEVPFCEFRESGWQPFPYLIMEELPMISHLAVLAHGFDLASPADSLTLRKYAA